MDELLLWGDPPDSDDLRVPTRGEIAAVLARRRGEWAIVARHDRAARAAAHVGRITAGREYGGGYEAEARRSGNEHRVYARKQSV
jgi:hypothetical protein